MKIDEHGGGHILFNQENVVPLIKACLLWLSSYRILEYDNIQCCL